MIEFYPQIKSVHVMMVIASGGLFALRGLLLLLGQSWAMSWPLRWSSYAIDTTLLTAAMMLLTILPGSMFANGWLATKIVLLVVYIVLGTMALKRGRTRNSRAGFYVAALLVYGFMFSIARAHHPLGILSGVFG